MCGVTFRNKNKLGVNSAILNSYTVLIVKYNFVSHKEGRARQKEFSERKREKLLRLEL